MRILVTNDDGIESPGLKQLAKKASLYGDVIIVAPKVEQSGQSHAINVTKGLLFEKLDDLVPNAPTYLVDSTPADCVRFATYYLHDEFDIVFSGVNKGYNLGEDIMYSGTVAAASEAVFAGKKGISFSAHHDDTVHIDKYFEKIYDYIFKGDLLSMGKLYNINIPLGDAKGIRITHQGNAHYNTKFVNEDDLVYQKGKPHFDKDHLNTNSDVTAIFNNYISITPLTVDRTDQKVLEKIINR